MGSMAKRQFELTEEEQRAFEQAEWQTRDAYELRRLQAVRLYGSGVATAEIVRVLNCSDRRIRKWSQKYREGSSGFEIGLAGRERAEVEP